MRLWSADEIAWDCRDIDGDGFHEIITSPINLGHNGGNYFPQFKTRIWRWNPLTRAILFLNEFDGIPYIVQGFQEAETRYGPHGRSDGYPAGLSPVLVGDEGGGVGIYTIDASGNVSLQMLAAEPPSPPPPSPITTEWLGALATSLEQSAAYIRNAI